MPISGNADGSPWVIPSFHRNSNRLLREPWNEALPNFYHGYEYHNPVRWRYTRRRLRPHALQSQYRSPKKLTKHLLNGKDANKTYRTHLDHPSVSFPIRQRVHFVPVGVSNPVGIAAGTSKTLLSFSSKIRSLRYFGLSSGKRITSRIDSAPVNVMTRRSMPTPMPPAGGMPYSSAVRKSSSSFCCSSPACFSRRCR